MLALPPLFVHFALVFPERQESWAKSPRGRALVPLLYVPAILLGLTRVSVLLAGGLPGDALENWIVALDRAEMLQLVSALVVGQTIMTRTLGRLRSVTARRQLRWIVWGTLAGALPFALFYGLPYALGYHPWDALGLLVILLALVPLAFASAVVRYRLMDVEVIIKRTVVYATVLAAIATIYTITLRFATDVFLGRSVTSSNGDMILAVGSAIQAVVLFAIGLSLLGGDARRRRAAGVAFLVATTHAGVAAWFMSQAIGIQDELAGVLAGAVATLVAAAARRRP